jgi:hypothetical protein
MCLITKRKPEYWSAARQAENHHVARPWPAGRLTPAITIQLDATGFLNSVQRTTTIVVGAYQAQ